MLKLATSILGEDYKILKSSTPESRKKVSVLGTSILIPVTLWFIQGFLATYLILEKELWVSLIAGMITSSLIFFLDRAIISAPGNAWVNLMRIILGIPIAIIGSLIIDEIILENDIDNHISVYMDKQVMKNKDQFVTSSSGHLDSLKVQLDLSRFAWRSKLDEASKEADGSSGSGNIGYGAIAKLKAKQAKSLEREYLAIKSEYDAENIRILQEAVASEDAFRKGFNENSLLTKILVLWDLVNDSGIGQFVYTILFIVLLSLELLPIMIKIIWKKQTAYENYKNYLDKMAGHRIEKLLERDIRTFNPGLASHAAGNISSLPKGFRY